MVWKCPACTYENSDGAALVCDMCDKSRAPAGSPTRPSAVEQPAVTLPPPPPPQQDVLHKLHSAIARADVDEARRILARLGIVLSKDDPPPTFDASVPVGHPRALLRAAPIIRSRWGGVRTLPPPRPPQQDVLHKLVSAIARADMNEARRILARLGTVLPEDDPPPPFDASVPVGHPRALLRAAPIISSRW